jgi:hypothetical protein
MCRIYLFDVGWIDQHVSVVVDLHLVPYVLEQVKELGHARDHVALEHCVYVR